MEIQHLTEMTRASQQLQFIRDCAGTGGYTTLIRQMRGQEWISVVPLAELLTGKSVDLKQLFETTCTYPYPGEEKVKIRGVPYKPDEAMKKYFVPRNYTVGNHVQCFLNVLKTGNLRWLAFQLHGTEQCDALYDPLMNEYMGLDNIDLMFAVWMQTVGISTPGYDAFNRNTHPWYEDTYIRPFGGLPLQQVLSVLAIPRAENLYAIDWKV